MTFGKWAVGLKVTGMKGGSVTFGQAFVRRLLDPIDLGTCFGVVAFIVAKTSPRNQRLGDLIAKTVVSEASRA